jgi:hypothetical protein
VASAGWLQWLEAAGGGYPDHAIRRSRDNHARILSKRAAEEADQRQEKVPALTRRRRPGINTCRYFVDKLVYKSI